MPFTDKIPATFGAADKIFASHENDAKRAANLLVDCLEENVTTQRLIEEVTAHLSGLGCSTKHIDEQIQKVRSKFSAWLG